MKDSEHSSRLSGAIETARVRLGAPSDIAPLVYFRIALGLLLFGSTLRFVLSGWVERFFVTPTYFFPYYGFDWLPRLSGEAMLGVHIAIMVLALMFTAGLFFRLAAPLLFLAFTYVELLDVTNYLNHYYLVSLLLFLSCFMPLADAFSFDARRRAQRGEERKAPPFAWLFLLRFQIGVVYIFAALAKLEPDWLIHAQPMGIWLASRTDTPLIGSLLTLPYVPHIFSWAGFLNDLLAVPLLLHPRTRKFAFVVVVLFHIGTHLLFTIGIFPVLMPLMAALFFPAESFSAVLARVRGGRRPTMAFTRARDRDGDRDRDRDGDGDRDRDSVGFARAQEVLRPTMASPRETSSSGRRLDDHDLPILPEAFTRARDRDRVTLPTWAMVGLTVYCLIQLLVPLRVHAYGTDVLWAEEGMRYSWRVMLREKNGSVMYKVRTREWEREREVPPSRYLTSHQEREMSGQPDMILSLAHHIADEYRGKGLHDVEVRVEARVSLNGRMPAPMIDPSVDLAKVAAGVLPSHYLLPEPGGAPLVVRPHLSRRSR